MSKIRCSNTGIEKVVFRYLKARGVYFKKHYNKIVGRPDLAQPKKMRAVFIDGDFWHGWHFDKYSKRLPKKYWVKKIQNNIMRDQKNRRALRRAGWKVMRIWEHQLENDQLNALKKIVSFFKERS